MSDVPLSSLTTLGVGGPARWFLEVASVEQLKDALRWSVTRELPFFILGGGSNLLVVDSGFDGLVVKIALRGIDVREDGESVLVRAAAGERWDDLVLFAVERDLAGVECLSGIPGLVGATPIQNVGAYGQEVSETIEEVEVLEIASGEISRLSNADCRFGYRQSIFKREAKGRFVVLGVTYRLTRGGAPALRYPDLQRMVEHGGNREPSLADVRESVIAIRRKKGMVLDPGDLDTRSAGSFFMNPVVSQDAYEEVVARARDAGIPREEKVPSYPQGNEVKLSAAWLIEKAGFHRGYGAGRAALSTKHTLAVTNRGNATAEEVLGLVREIQDGVEGKFGLRLDPEPEIVGER
ncbi:MAG: UDP-N-acetylmuramate dehydrogenase [Thermoanaerobaculia bacterium]